MGNEFVNLIRSMLIGEVAGGTFADCEIAI